MNAFKQKLLKIIHKEELEVLDLCIKSAREYAKKSYEEPILPYTVVNGKIVINLYEEFTIRYKVDSMDACLKAAECITKRLGLEELYSDEIKEIRNLGYNKFLDSRLDFAKIAATMGYDEKRIHSILRPVWRYVPENRTVVEEIKEIKRLLGYTY